ncbi:BQ5605_C003g02186 [Microbotryum silenes-dioicae]|uniref:BQ5605_C003g02186 protein n=1 Tax=Microbotryum silenes-dioicae TaxID=796604 RepID=A0A2X0NY98_9BASI|nr:BQ5605_C003g02186 [Microbotryum silenes-dioicae]
MACFHPVIFGDYLAKNLAPVERDDVRWGYILLVRAYDLALGGYLWPRVDGLAKRDGALFGAIMASVSRIGLLVFERAYFLLSTETVSTLFLIDLVSLIAAFSLLPILLPHSVESRPTSSALMRLERHPELIINIALSIGISTFVCAFLGYAVERLGAQQFIKMLETPTVAIPSLRHFLEPLSMPRHIIHSLFLSILTIPFVSIFPTTGSVRLALIAFLLVAPQTATLLWDVLPLHGEAAFYVGAFEGVKAAISSAVTAWTIEELRARRERIETVYAIALIEDEDEKSSLLVVAEGMVEEEPVTSA